MQISSPSSVSSHAVRFSMPGTVFAATPAGTIRMGRTITGPGKSTIPFKDDQFRVTLPIKHEGDWVAAPIDEKLRKAGSDRHKRLLSIPVTVQFNDPGVVMRSRLEAYDPVTNRLVCASAGAGEALRRGDSGELVRVACDGCNKCPFANRSAEGSICKPLGRLHVQIDGQESELDTYVLRTTGYHSQRNLESRLWQYWSLFGKRLRGLKMTLTLREMQTATSFWESFFVADLALRKDLKSSLIDVQQQATSDEECGLDLKGYEDVVRQGLTNAGGWGDSDAEPGMELAEFGFVDAGAYRSSIPQEPATTQQDIATALNESDIDSSSQDAMEVIARVSASSSAAAEKHVEASVQGAPAPLDDQVAKQAVAADMVFSELNHILEMGNEAVSKADAAAQALTTTSKVVVETPSVIESPAVPKTRSRKPIIESVPMDSLGSLVAGSDCSSKGHGLRHHTAFNVDF